MVQITLHICEEQPISIEGLQKVLREAEDFAVCGVSTDFTQALAAAAEQKPKLLLLGQPVPNKPVLPVISQIRNFSPDTRVVLWIADLSEMDTFRAIQLGARGVVRKNSPVASLLECLRGVAAGNVWIGNTPNADVNPTRGGIHRITPREREIVEYICQGMKNREIAAALRITPGTVKVHLMHIFEKTGVKDRFQLALQARQILGLDQVAVGGAQR